MYRGIETVITEAPELEGQSAYVLRYENPAECAEDMRREGLGEREGGTAKRGDWDMRKAWFGNETMAEAAQYATSGNDALVTTAEQFLAQVESGGLETARAVWNASPVGAYPIIPEVLAGRPECMRRRMEESQDRHPVRVYVDSTSSGGIGADALHKRGAAVLAFVMALAQERPVELWQVTTLDAYGYRRNLAALAVRLPTAPMNLAVCAHLLTSQAWVRGIGYGWAYKAHKAAGGWPFGEPGGNHTPKLRHALGLAPEDVWVPSIYLHDPLVANPVAWINRELARIREAATAD